MHPKEEEEDKEEEENADCVRAARLVRPISWTPSTTSFHSRATKDPTGGAPVRNRGQLLLRR